jgi:hypothetical protein
MPSYIHGVQKKNDNGLFRLQTFMTGVLPVTPADENRCFRRAGFLHPALLVENLTAAYEMPLYVRPIEEHVHGKSRLFPSRKEDHFSNHPISGGKHLGISPVPPPPSRRSSS